VFTLSMETQVFAWGRPSILSLKHRLFIFILNTRWWTKSKHWMTPMTPSSYCRPTWRSPQNTKKKKNLKAVLYRAKQQ